MGKTGKLRQNVFSVCKIVSNQNKAIGSFLISLQSSFSPTLPYHSLPEFSRYLKTLGVLHMDISLIMHGNIILLIRQNIAGRAARSVDYAAWFRPTLFCMEITHSQNILIVYLYQLSSVKCQYYS